MKQLIVNADDLGLTQGHNAAILQAHRHGIVTSASVLANGTAFDDAADQLRTAPDLSVGVHLTLLEGLPVLPPHRLPDLVGANGQFGLSYRTLMGRLAAQPAILSQVEAEWEVQIRRVLDAGLLPSHLDSHKHLHLFPPLVKVIVRLARRFTIGAVRLPLEWPPFGIRQHPGRLGAWAVVTGLAWLARPRLRAGGLGFPDHFVGLLHSGQWSASALAAVLGRLQPGTTELMAHPGRADADTATLLQQGYTWIRDYDFDREATTFGTASILRALDRHGIQPVNYQTWLHAQGEHNAATPSLA